MARILCLMIKDKPLFFKKTQQTSRNNGKEPDGEQSVPDDAGDGSLPRQGKGFRMHSRMIGKA